VRRPGASEASTRAIHCFSSTSSFASRRSATGDIRGSSHCIGFRPDPRDKYALPRASVPERVRRNLPGRSRRCEGSAEVFGAARAAGRRLRRGFVRGRVLPGDDCLLEGSCARRRSYDVEHLKSRRRRPRLMTSTHLTTATTDRTSPSWLCGGYSMSVLSTKPPWRWRFAGTTILTLTRRAF
jgi:hypothetical protein